MSMFMPSHFSIWSAASRKAVARVSNQR